MNVALTFCLQYSTIQKNTSSVLCIKTWYLGRFRKNVKKKEKCHCRSGAIDYHLLVERFERFEFLLVGQWTIMKLAASSMNESEVSKNRLLLERILKIEIEFIESDEFESMLNAQIRPGVFETVPVNPSPRVQEEVEAENLPCLAPALGEPLLSFAEEQHEFRRMNFLKFQASRLQLSLDADQPDVKVLNQIERLLSDAKDARDHIIRSNMRLVVSNAGKYCTSSYGFEDLVSDGSLSLMEAVEKFNYQLGFRFSTYATHAIRRSFFRKIERKQKDRKRFSVTDPEIMMSAPDHQEVDYDAPAEARLMEHMVEVMSDHLTERERQIIEGRFGLNGRGEPKTLMQLSSDLGICKERVRQVEGNALKKLHAVAVEYNRRQLASANA